MRQVLPLLVLPMTIGMVIVVTGLALRKRWVSGIGVALLWLTSTPLASGCLMRATEGWGERLPAEAAPSADAVVVLSTGRFIAPGAAQISEWIDADRFFAGVELFRAGKSPLMVFTGAASNGAPPAPLEGEVLARYAQQFGVPSDRIRVTGLVTNTEDEAREVAAILGPAPAGHRVLLVTSAFHMDRARRLFERQRFVVVPFPVDFRQQGRDGFEFSSLIPTGGAAAQTQLSLRELLGRLFYRLVGP